MNKQNQTEAEQEWKELQITSCPILAFIVPYCFLQCFNCPETLLFETTFQELMSGWGALYRGPQSLQDPKGVNSSISLREAVQKLQPEPRDAGEHFSECS